MICWWNLDLLVESYEDQFWVQDQHTRNLISEGIEEHGVYKLHDYSVPTHHLSPSIISDLWHAKYGHLNYNYLQWAFNGPDGDRAAIYRESQEHV